MSQQQQQPSKIPYRNKFVNSVPTSSSQASVQKNQDFQEYYRGKKLDNAKQQQRQLLQQQQQQSSYFYKRVSVVNVDSRDRDRTIYPKPNEFEVFLGRTFFNIYSIKLVSIEFPNTDDIIKDSPASVKNNVIAWSNEEDKDIGYPEYSVDIRSGTYSAVTLQSELESKMNSVKRRNGVGQFHYFKVLIDLDQNSVSFTSLDLRQLPANPIEVEKDSTIITIYQPNHGFTTGTIVYLTGCRLTAGIPSSLLNSSHEITVRDDDRYFFEVNLDANDTLQGGGTNCRAGVVSPFKFHFGRRTDTLQKILGFPREDSAVQIGQTKALQTFVYPITNVTIGTNTILHVPNHGLSVGMKIKIFNLKTVPPIYEGNPIYSIVAIPSSNEITINFSTTYFDIETLQNAFIGTGKVRLTFPNHGFNSIVSIVNTALIRRVELTTLLDHQLETGDKIIISGSNSTPSIDGEYTVTKLDVDKLIITLNGNFNTLTQPGDYAFMAPNQNFYIYNCQTTGGIKESKINNELFTIDRIVDENTFEFLIPDAYSEANDIAGGENIKISSSIHGFSGTHTNISSDNTLIRPIALSGENYAFLCCQTLANVYNTGPVSDIFAKIKLSQPPGTIIFDQFVSKPKTFDEGLLTSINTLLFQVKIHDNILFEFNDVDFSFTLEIEEVIENLSNSLLSTQRNVNMTKLVS